MSDNFYGRVETLHKGDAEKLVGEPNLVGLCMTGPRHTHPTLTLRSGTIIRRYQKGFILISVTPDGSDLDKALNHLKKGLGTFL